MFYSKLHELIVPRAIIFVQSFIFLKLKNSIYFSSLVTVTDIRREITGIMLLLSLFTSVYNRIMCLYFLKDPVHECTTLIQCAITVCRAIHALLGIQCTTNEIQSGMFAQKKKLAGLQQVGRT